MENHPIDTQSSNKNTRIKTTDEGYTFVSPLNPIFIYLFYFNNMNANAKILFLFILF